MHKRTTQKNREPPPKNEERTERNQSTSSLKRARASSPKRSGTPPQIRHTWSTCSWCVRVACVCARVCRQAILSITVPDTGFFEARTTCHPARRIAIGQVTRPHARPHSRSRHELSCRRLLSSIPPPAILNVEATEPRLLRRRAHACDTPFF